jgi:hypothetical protein
LWSYHVIREHGLDACQRQLLRLDRVAQDVANEPSELIVRLVRLAAVDCRRHQRTVLEAQELSLELLKLLLQLLLLFLVKSIDNVNGMPHNSFTLSLTL